MIQSLPVRSPFPRCRRNTSHTSGPAPCLNPNTRPLHRACDGCGRCCIPAGGKIVPRMTGKGEYTICRKGCCESTDPIRRHHRRYRGHRRSTLPDRPRPVVRELGCRGQLGCSLCHSRYRRHRLGGPVPRWETGCHASRAGSPCLIPGVS
jgi:hypothetical protein